MTSSGRIRMISSATEKRTVPVRRPREPVIREYTFTLYHCAKPAADLAASKRISAEPASTKDAITVLLSFLSDLSITG